MHRVGWSTRQYSLRRSSSSLRSASSPAQLSNIRYRGYQRRPMLAGSGVVRHRVVDGLVGVQLDAEHLGGAADDTQRDRGEVLDELFAGHPPRAVEIRTEPPVGGCRGAAVGGECREFEG